MEVCHPDWNGKPTEKAYKVLVELLVELCRKYRLEPTQAIIRHYDVTEKVLQKMGIISSPDVWISGEYSRGNVRSLIIKVNSCVKSIM